VDPLASRSLRFQIVRINYVEVSSQIGVILYRNAINYCYDWDSVRRPIISDRGQYFRAFNTSRFGRLCDTVYFEHLLEPDKFQLGKIFKITDRGYRQFT